MIVAVQNSVGLGINLSRERNEADAGASLNGIGIDDFSTDIAKRVIVS